MRSLAIVLLVLATATSARAGAPKLTATNCTLDGEPLVFRDDLEHRGGLAVAPDGGVIVLDGANRVRRYRPKPGSGKGCALALDRTLGRNGVLDVGIGADRFGVTVAVDSDGTIYVSDVPKQPVRIEGGKVEKMCGDHTRVNASAASPIVWRYNWATEATRERGDCSGAKSAYLKGWDVGASHLWVIDERAAAYGDLDGGKHQILLYGADGERTATLAIPDADFVWTPERITRCGKTICGLPIGKTIALWDDQGALTGTVNTETLLGLTSDKFSTIDLDGATGTTYLLVQTGELDKRTAGGIVRIDGFAK
jgi:hypothetical protein